MKDASMDDVWDTPSLSTKEALVNILLGSIVFITMSPIAMALTVLSCISMKKRQKPIYRQKFSVNVDGVRKQI
jgi:hypothetical protein